MKWCGARLLAGVGALAAVCLAAPARAQPFMLKDIWSRLGGAYNSSNPRLLGVIQGKVIFDTTDGLYASDGTDAGTVMISNLPAAPNNQDYWFPGITGSRLIFGRGVNLSGEFKLNEIWGTDGTAAGTVRLPPLAPSYLYVQGSFASGASRVFYVVDDAEDQYSRLWATDGTVAGTVEIEPGPTMSYVGVSGVAGNELYYARTPNSNGSGTPTLWKTSGNTAVSLGIPPNSSFNPAGAATGRFFFTSTNSATGVRTMHAIDSSGTHVVAGLPTGTGGLAALGSRLICLHEDTGGTPRIEQLWQTDATTSGMLADLGSSPIYPYDGAVAGSRYYAWICSTNRVVTTDGTSAGTAIFQTPTLGDWGYVNGFVPVGNRCFFQVHTSANNPSAPSATVAELWSSDGTVAGTHREFNSMDGPEFAPSGVFADGNTRFFFVNTHSVTGTELWVSNGAAGGTHIVKDLAIASPGSNPVGFAALALPGGNVPGRVLFTADDGDGSDLWTTDGTAPGTRRVGPYRFADRLSGSLLTAGLYYLLNSGHLYRTDGTAAGTIVLGPLIASTVSPRVAAAPSGRMYFATYNSTEGYQFWRSDGTPEGTVAITSRAGGYTLYAPGGFMALGDSVICFAIQNNGFRLFRIDGQTDQVQVVPFPVGPNTQNLFGLVSCGTFAIFQTNAYEVWRTDGTGPGTYRIMLGDSPMYSAATGGRAIFCMPGSTTFPNVYTTDGTFAGTTVLAANVRTSNLLSLGSRALFPAGGRNWVTDGTPAGTMMVSATAPTGTFFRLGGGVAGFFSSGNLWRTDGTAMGTVQVGSPLPAGATLVSAPGAPIMLGQRVLFSASTNASGAELWEYDLRTAADCNSNGVPDTQEIALGMAPDANHDGVLDSCECLADWSGGGVAVQDIFDFIGDWFAGSADFNHSGATTTDDVFDFLNAWFVGCGP